MTLPVYTNPSEAPDWQQKCVKLERWLFNNYHRLTTRTMPDGTSEAFPVYRVPAPSRPHPWPESKQMPPSDYFTKHFIEQQ